MNSFETKYKRLNTAQKLAVDTVEGPVIVIAGPGTGKTELLSMRVANILRKTDALPENILCLTFTESGAAAMRERLTGLMGKDAYHIGVHTFHSFGSEIINKYSDYFYSGASFQPADELATHQILTKIFDNLPHSDILAKKMNGEYTQLRYVQNSISDFKKSGLTADEIQRILLNNTRFMDHAEPLLSSFFDRPMHSSMWQEVSKLVESIAIYKETPLEIRGFKELSMLFLADLTQVYTNNEGQTKTTALTAWRNTWLEKNEKGRFVFKNRKRQEKLSSASMVYYQYLTAMLDAGLYDYDDMILRVVHALDVFPDLRYNLQEQYQYILVDEFQDTNGAQLRILLSLTNNTNEGRPNILVVGDDDQAIYSFQGAELSNITTLQTSVIEPVIIPLTDNYRSSKQVLSASRDIITQGIDRLENRVTSLNKELVPCRDMSDSAVELHEYSSQEQEYSAIAEDVARRLKDNHATSSIAILARGHKDIRNLLPYLASHNIPVSYEHRDNILESPPVVALLSLARTIHAISQAHLVRANTLLPELLSQPFWSLKTQDLWQLSVTAHSEKRLWLEVMLESDNRKLREIAHLLIKIAYNAPHQSLEYTLDQLIGTVPIPHEEGEHISPFKTYYFDETKVITQPQHLSDYLSAIRHLRMSLREYKPQAPLHLSDFIEYIDQSIAAGLRFMVNVEREQDETHSVHVMTAHKSKGLEFETVYIINATDSTWGSRSRGGMSRLSYPENIAIAPAGETNDERLRLFFVAMTRAKKELYISYAQQDEKAKSTLKSEFLSTDYWESQPKHAAHVVTNHETVLHWSEKVSQPDISLQTALSSRLKTYALSATHLNAFLDVTHGGPRGFLLQNLLHFPQAIPPSAAFGSAIHNTLRHAQEHLNTTGQKRPVEDSLYDFESYLKAQRLEEDDFKRQLQKGSDVLPAYLAAHDRDFVPGAITERDFRRQGVVIGDARVTGILDKIFLDTESHTINITDFKTGNPASSWKGKTDYEKIKLHKYRQQLMFYKLLIEHSRDYKRYSPDTLELSFVEPDSNGDFHRLEANFTDEDIKVFTTLINKVWQHIITADFPDTSSYDQNYKGIVAFEDFLINS